MLRPEVRYAPAADGSKIGYTVTGRGPLTAVLTPSLLTQAELLYEEPAIGRFFGALAERCQLLILDRRGTGFSDRPSADHELSMGRACEDIEAVLRHAEVDKAVLMTHSWGGPAAIRFAATRPRRTAGLALIATCAKNSRDDGYELGPTPDEHHEFGRSLVASWGTREPLIRVAPSMTDHQSFIAWRARQERHSFPPGTVPAVVDALTTHDARRHLAAVTAPTLVLHRRGDEIFEVDHARYLAAAVKGATLCELGGKDHLFFIGDRVDMLRTLVDFLESLAPPRRATPPSWSFDEDEAQWGSGTLTDAERGIALLVARGLSNKQIAAERSISRYTVDAHLRSIYRKMRVANRTALAHQMVIEQFA